MTSRARPGRPFSPLFIAGLIVTVWWLVAHGSGDGWVQTLGDAVFAVLLIGVLGPAWFVARARVAVVAGPADATAGHPVEVSVTATSRVRLTAVSPPGPESFAGPSRRGRPGRGRSGQAVTLIPVNRGVHEEIVVDVASAAPFGLQWWTRRLVLRLPTPLHVAPRTGSPMDRRYEDDDAEGDGGRYLASHAGETKGIRQYMPGDLRTHIHWSATAHTGEMMVKEMETAAAEPIMVTVRLPADPESAERVAERAMGTISHLLASDEEVLLTTTETAGERVGLISGRPAAGRRLARAVSSADGARPGIEVG